DLGRSEGRTHAGHRIPAQAGQPPGRGLPRGLRAMAGHAPRSAGAALASRRAAALHGEGAAAAATRRGGPKQPQPPTHAPPAGASTIAYPEGAARLRSGASVSVSVTFVVTENGEVMDARVVESGGKILDETVLSAVRKWKYAPATKRGTKVKVQTTFRQTFRA